MRAAAIAVAIVAAFVGVMYLRFASDTVPAPPAGAGGPQCVVFRNVSDGNDARAQATCSPRFESPAAPVLMQPRTPMVTPISSTRPNFLHDTEVSPLGMGPEVELPPGVSLIIETGCTQCDGPTTGIVRVYRDPSGAIRTDTLASVEKLQLPPRIVQTAKGTEEHTPEIAGFAIDPDGSELTVAFCTRGICPGGSSTDAETTLFHSKDGGITWTELGKLGAGQSMRRVLLANGAVIVASWLDGEEKNYMLPGGQEVKPPPGYTASSIFGVKALANGELLWQTGDGRLLRSDGTTFFDPTGQAVVGELLSDPLGTGFVFAGISSSPTSNYIVHLGSDGRVLDAYSSPHFLLLGAWPQENMLFGNTSVYMGELGGPLPSPFFANYLPTLIDLHTNTIHPIREPFIDSPLANGRNTVLAVQRGPFALVVNTDNTCLNVRAEPLPSAGILDCAAEGVLLRDLGQAVDFAGSTWLHVATPAGAEGWANTAYLER